MGLCVILHLPYSVIKVNTFLHKLECEFKRIVAITKVDPQDENANDNISSPSVSSEISPAPGYQISVSAYQLTFCLSLL